MVSICNTCQNLQRPSKAPDGATHEPFRWLKTTLPALRRSATAGCRGCALVLQGILLHHDRLVGVNEDAVRIAAESFTAVSGKQVQDHLSLELRWTASEDDCGEVSDDDHHHHEHELTYPDLKLEFYTDQDGQSPFPAIGRGRRISDNFFQDGGLERAKAIIETCVSHHSKCQRRTPPSLPRRVLDVHHHDGSNSIKLYETATCANGRFSESGNYITLSHCWGIGQNILRTTTSNLKAHQNSIPWSSLPKTFQEAVAITRALGLRYLWVDALCIVQDDAIEYAEQSLQMAEIYSNSFLTVAATSSPDSTYGCILPKKQPFKVQATDSKGSLYKIYVREQPSHYSFKGQFNEDDHMNDWVIPFNCSDEANRETPLLKRAWAFQERLLSPRVLHFTWSEMILECREAIQCECGRVDDPIYDPRTTDTIKREFADFTEHRVPELLAAKDSSDAMEGVVHQLANAGLEDSIPSSTPSKEEAIQLWSYVVTEYSSRNLTFDRDRLLAIAGVAKQFAPVLGGYIAGQWTSSTLNLLWYPSNPSICRRPHPSSTPVPSWSWAAIEGSSIEFDNSTAMDLGCRAIFPANSDRNTSSPEAWSPTSGQAIELSAAMLTEVVLKIDDESNFTLMKHNVGVEFTPDVGVPRGDDALASGDTLVCVLASMTWRSSIIGLVLKATKLQPQAYRRVGRFECYECEQEGQTDDSESQDAEALLTLWFPEIEDMTQLDEGPLTTISVV
ncbi:HET-domain-containing protein [Lophium mytilinum]|uniref:HET-domain-containing protein n=1 Tax=Lophium mytilinum TaxID=390894 RepID=A0A6A6QNK9_9PEZI|nr:HET-domain-containing protein [Lophium mytilinum]